MRNKVFMALLLAGALAFSPISGSFLRLDVRASAAVDVSGNDPGGSAGNPGTLSFEQARKEFEDLANSETATREQVYPLVIKAMDALMEEVGGRDALAEAMLNDSSTVAEMENLFKKVSRYGNGYSGVKVDQSLGEFGIEQSTVTAVGATFWSNQRTYVNYIEMRLFDKERWSDRCPDITQADPEFDADKTVFMDIGYPNDNGLYPVVITMPVPKGLTADKVEVLLYQVGEFTPLHVKRNSDDTISFCVTSVSVIPAGDYWYEKLAFTQKTEAENPATADFDQALKELEDLASDPNATEEQKKAAAGAVKDALAAEAGGTDALAEAMLDDSGAFAEFEEAYCGIMGMEPTGVSVVSSDAASVGINTSNVKVVGAGLNELQDGSTQAGLNMTDVKEAKPDIAQAGSDFDTGRTVFVDIWLSGVKDSGNLKYPVMITIPVPNGFDADRFAVLHYADGTNKTPHRLKVKTNSDNTVSFCVSSFSVFAFTEVKQASGDSDDDNDGSETGYTEDLENRIASAAQGATVKFTGINTLPNSVMKELLARKDVTLVMEYTYDGRDYTVTIPAGRAVDNDIPWYGPLYLSAHYGNGAAAADGSVYIVKSGDTMSGIARANHMPLSKLAEKNPQVKNIDLIRVGQKINL